MNKDFIINCINIGNYKISNETFTSNISLDSIVLKKPLEFRNCSFNRKLIIRLLSNNNLIFFNCSFDKVLIQSCNLNMISFSNMNSLKELNINDCNLEILKISSKNTFSSDYNIISTNIRHSFDCSSLENPNGSFNAVINMFVNEEVFLKSRFFKSIFYNFSIMGKVGDLNFQKVDIKNTCEFSEVIFKNSYFNDSQLGLQSVFNACNFESIVSFKSCVNSNNNELFLQICDFKKHAYFTDAEFKHFEIRDTTFENRVSFDGLKTDTVLLHLVNFNRTALFDDLKVYSLEKLNFFKSLNSKDANAWRRTLRQIKQELQKAENKIDYNRFRAYELSAYYQELNWKWNDGFKDKVILWATNHVTGFNHSWRKALRFTLIASLFFYSLFFITENYTYPFDLGYYREFLSGSFRFLLVTDFYNPLSNGREYIHSTNTIGWFIFILGKIVIAFGIYEMIQAFRKFKA